ncbi:MAG: glycoside hydrolase family 3 N-terminal domain-containing protein [Myxococcota bacterium]
MWFVPIIASAQPAEDTAPAPVEVVDLARSWADQVARERGVLPPAAQSLVEGWCRRAERSGRAMGDQNVHLDLGFRVDLPFRGLSADPLLASLIVREYLRCLPPERCVGVKHFPGLGPLKTDPHRALAAERFELDAFLQRDLRPFFTAVDEGACAVMTSHLRLRTTPGDPTICTFDRDCVALLRQGLGYDGLIVSDEILVMDAAQEAMVDLLFRPEGLSGDVWDALPAAERRRLSLDRRLRDRCGGPESCTVDEIRDETDAVDDVDGSRRTLLAIRAGHDLVLQFRVPERQSDQLRYTADVVVAAVEAGTIPRSQIDASVLRILALKDRLFGPALYGAFPGADSPESLLAQLSLRQKVLQMFAADGRFDREHIEGIGLGALYLPGPDAVPSAAPIPMLFLGDAIDRGGGTPRTEP